MTALFRPLSMYASLPASPPPDVGQFDPTVAPAGTWTLPDGTPAHTCRSREPWIHDRVQAVWRGPLGDAANPATLLFGSDCVVVQGQEARGSWNAQGELVKTIRRRTRAAWLDSAGPRLLTDDVEGGLYSHFLPSFDRESRVMLGFPSGHTARQILPGPSKLLVLLTLQRSPTHDNHAVVEIVRTSDWRNVQNKILYGLDPVAGIIREDDCDVDGALAHTGPVLATPDGILWCDWQLNPLGEHRHSLKPLTISVDGLGRAFVLGEDSGRARLTIVPPGGPAVANVELPELPVYEYQPPLIAANGASYVLLPGQLVALDPAGKVAWRQACGNNPRGMIAANNLLLLADGDLYAVTPDGDRVPLWTPPSPLCSAPLLVNGRIFVATADELFTLAGGK